MTDPGPIILTGRKDRTEYLSSLASSLIPTVCCVYLLKTHLLSSLQYCIYQGAWAVNKHGPNN